MQEIDALVLRDNARQQLMQIRDVETGIEYLNKVKAIEVWAKAEKKDAELQNMIAEQKIRTQRILGQLIKQGQEAGEIASQYSNPGGNYKFGVPQGNTKTLTDIGITRKQSSTFQAIASIPEETFEQVIAEKKQAVTDAVAELTTAGMLHVAKEVKSAEKIEQSKLTSRDARLIDALKNGETVVVNQHTDLATIKWATEHNLFVRCDRFSEWGNPYEMGKDGDRSTVCDNYKEHYIDFKPSLLAKISILKGKALGCWCAPNACHCDTLKAIADEN